MTLTFISEHSILFMRACDGGSDVLARFVDYFRLLTRRCWPLRCSHWLAAPAAESAASGIVRCWSLPSNMRPIPPSAALSAPSGRGSRPTWASGFQPRWPSAWSKLARPSMSASPWALSTKVDLKLQAEQAEAEFSRRHRTAYRRWAAAASEQRAERPARAKGWTTDAQDGFSALPPLTRHVRASDRAERSVETHQELSLMRRWWPMTAASSAATHDRARPGGCRGPDLDPCRAALPEKEAVVAIPRRSWVGRQGEALGLTSHAVVEAGQEVCGEAARDNPRRRADPPNAPILPSSRCPGAGEPVLFGMTATLTLARKATDRVAKLPLSGLATIKGGKPLASMSSTTSGEHRVGVERNRIGCSSFTSYYDNSERVQCRTYGVQPVEGAKPHVSASGPCLKKVSKIQRHSLRLLVY